MYPVVAEPKSRLLICFSSQLVFFERGEISTGYFGWRDPCFEKTVGVPFGDCAILEGCRIHEISQIECTNAHDLYRIDFYSFNQGPGFLITAKEA